jgi:hypothetical protein
VTRSLGLAAALVAAAAPLGAQTMRSYVAGRPASAPPTVLRATLEFGAGRVVVRAGSEGTLYGAQFRYDADRFTPVHRYEPRTGTLRLGLESVGRAGIRVTSRSHLEQVARFELSPRVPLELETSLGSSEAILDLGNLTLERLAVRAGATRGTIDFSLPTQGNCREATFALGAGELVAMRLANAGCAAIRIEGGVGRTVLDLSGTWRRDVRIEAELAMGTLVVRIPRGTGVEVTAQRFLARFAMDGLEKDGDAWRTPGFAAARHKVALDLQTNVAGFEIEWLD